MKIFKKALMLPTFMLFAIVALKAQNEEIDTKIKHLFKISGVEQTYKNSIENMLDIFSQNDRTLDESIIKDLKQEFTADDNITEILDEIRDIYKKHFTLADIKGLIAFYESPIGKKMTQTQPLILKESMEMGAEWGRKLANKVAKRISEKGKK